jgi:hypothetical protein
MEKSKTIQTRGKYTPDFLVEAGAPLTLAQLADRADSFSQSDLPIQVDLVDWASAQPGIRHAIERDKVVVWRAVQAN